MGSLALFGMHRLHLLGDAIFGDLLSLSRFGDYDLRYCIDHCRSDYRDDSFYECGSRKAFSRLVTIWVSTPLNGYCFSLGGNDN